jgi:RNA polymerase subunit RPABC4/transcription elongation factor Spt4
MEDRCISCGAIVPEGMMVCPQCMMNANEGEVGQHAKTG